MKSALGQPRTNRPKFQVRLLANPEPRERQDEEDDARARAGDGLPRFVLGAALPCDDDAGIAREGVRRRAAPQPAPLRRKRIGEGDYDGANV